MARPAADMSMGVRGYRPGMDYSPSASPDEDRASILIVDDRPDKLLVLETILQDLGQNIVVAHSGEEALKRVLEHDFAVILLDVNMPGMDGLETAAEDSAHAYHLCHRVCRRTSYRPRVLIGRGRLHPSPDPPGGSALEGESVCPVASDGTPDPAPGGGASRACARASWADCGRGVDPTV